MKDLAEIYSSIEEAEQQSRKGDLAKAVTEYNKALNGLRQNFEDSKSSQEHVGDEIDEALKLLQHDIETKLYELKILIDMRNSNILKNTVVGNPLPTTTHSMSSGISRSRSLDTAINNTSPATGLTMDPLLVSLLNKLQNNLIDNLNAELCDLNGLKIERVEAEVNQQILRFRKEILMYEQKKNKEQNSRLEQAIRENKKLSNQIIKLRERWDSLVESAKQRRGKKQDQ